MGDKMIKLSDLKINEEGKIIKINYPKTLRKRMLDLGIIKNAKIKKIITKKGISAYQINDIKIALRDEDIKEIKVEKWK